MKSYTSLARPERGRAICHWRSACRPSRLAVASTSHHSVISSARSPKPSARAHSVRRSGSFAASRCLSSTKSATCQSALGALARAQRSRSLIIELQTWLREQRARFSKNSDTTKRLDHIWRGFASSIRTWQYRSANSTRLRPTSRPRANLLIPTLAAVGAVVRSVALWTATRGRIATCDRQA